MTVIVAFVDQDGTVWMGADNATTDSDGELEYPKNPKLFARRNGPNSPPWLFGWAGDIRFGQVLQYEALLPSLDNGDSDILGILVTKFIPTWRTALKDAGAMKKDKEGESEEAGGIAMIGVQGRIFYIEANFQILDPSTPYTAIGEGRLPALGALGALSTVTSLGPEERVLIALEQAYEWMASVREPFLIINSREMATQAKIVRARRKRPKQRRS